MDNVSKFKIESEAGYIAEKQQIMKSGQQLPEDQIWSLMVIPGDENPYKSWKTLAAFFVDTHTISTMNNRYVGINHDLYDFRLFINLLQSLQFEIIWWFGKNVVIRKYFINLIKCRVASSC